MSGLTLRRIMNDTEYISKYSSFINDIERQMEETPDIYYLKKCFPISIDQEITDDLLNFAINSKSINTTQDIETHIPFTEKGINSYLYTLKEIIKNNEKKEEEKTVCCGGLFTPHNKNKIACDEKEVKKGAGSEYCFYNQMDEPNKRMMDICAEKGMMGMAKAIIDEMNEKKMTYAEMRALYG